MLVRGPIDACVGSPERLAYEGAAVIGRARSSAARSTDRRQRHAVRERPVGICRTVRASGSVRRTRQRRKERAGISATGAPRCRRSTGMSTSGRRWPAACRARRQKRLTTRRCRRGDQHERQLDVRAADAGTCVVLARRQELHRGGHSEGPNGVSPQRVLRSGRGNLVPVAQQRHHLHQRRAGGDFLACTWRCLCLCRAARRFVRTVEGAAGASHGGARVRCGRRRTGSFPQHDCYGRRCVGSVAPAAGAAA